MGRLFQVFFLKERFPDIGRIGRVRGTREFYVNGTPYVIIYRLLAGDRLIIETIVHTSMNFPDSDR